MALEEIVGALEILERLGTPLAIAGAASGTAALIKSIATLKRTREFKAHMDAERSHNTVSLADTLLACDETIARALAMRDREAYFRALGTITLTLQGSLSQYGEYVAHGARSLVPDLITLLLDASAADHHMPARALCAVSLQVRALLKGIAPPPADPGA